VMNPQDDHPAPAARPRVWLVSLSFAPDPADHPTVRDNRMVTWRPDPAGRYHSADGHHHATWSELHTRFDLVEVSAAA